MVFVDDPSDVVIGGEYGDGGVVNDHGDVVAVVVVVLIAVIQ